MRLVLLFLTLFVFTVAGVCQGNCARTNPLYKDHARFTPKEGSPVFTIKLNYIIPQKDDGSGNFQEDNAEFKTILENSIDEINALWGNLKKPKDEDCYPHDDFLPDSYIRFKLNAIIYVQNDRWWNAANGSFCPNDGAWYLNDLDEELRSQPAYNNAINVYMPNFSDAYEEVVVLQNSVDEPKSKPPCSELPSASKLSRSSRINLSGLFNKYWWMKNVVPYNEEYNSKLQTWEAAVKNWFSDGFDHTMVHELGHSMGLRHGNEYHGRNECHQSIMHQGHGKPHNYLQPTEIGKIHRELRMTNIRNFLVSDVYSSYPMNIEEDTDFSMDFKAYEDIIVKRGATMNVSCTLSMPERGRIIVEPGGTLIVDGATVQHRNARPDDELVILQKKRGWAWFSSKKGRVGTLQQLDGAEIQGEIVTKKRKKRST